MKITRMSLQSFRAFDGPFELDLDGGKNLLLHGENGSGKSSIYLALKHFFEEYGDDITRYPRGWRPGMGHDREWQSTALLSAAIPWHP